MNTESTELWRDVKKTLPEEGEIVDTRIFDRNGWHNGQRLKRRGNLWFLPDDSMYVYYVPTHWRPL